MGTILGVNGAGVARYGLILGQNGAGRFWEALGWLPEPGNAIFLPKNTKHIENYEIRNFTRRRSKRFFLGIRAQNPIVVGLGANILAKTGPKSETTGRDLHFGGGFVRKST